MMTEPQQSSRRWYPQHPMVAAHPVVVKDRRLLLVKRAKEPSKGRWSLPGGAIELGESVYEAGRREVLEECSIDIEIERVLDIADSIIKDDDGRIAYHFVIIYLTAHHKSGEIKAHSDAADIGWFTPAEIPGLDMHHQLRAVLVKAGLA